MTLLEALRSPFTRNGLEGGLLIAAACAAVGVLLRWRRLVWAGAAIPEAATAGASFALGQSTLLPSLGLAALGSSATKSLCALVAAGLAVLWLVPVGRPPRRSGERAAAACFLLGATLQVLFVAQNRAGTEELREVSVGQTLLFLSVEDLTTLSWWMPSIVVAALALARATAHIAFDRDHARAQGRRVVLAEASLAALVFALAVVAVPLAGAPFVFAYLVLPAAAAERLAARPIPTAIVAVVLALAGLTTAVAAAVAWDLPFSAAAAGGALLAAGAVVLVRGAAQAVTRLVRAGRRLFERGPSGRAGEGASA